jgi:hypothetical protein
MSQDRVFHVRGALPIPAGHPIEITTYSLNDDPQPYDPLVRDLSTGVVYARTWHYESGTSDVTRLPLDLRGDLRVVEKVVGRVRGARIVSGLCPDESGRHGWITTLLVGVES